MFFGGGKGEYMGSKGIRRSPLNWVNIILFIFYGPKLALFHESIKYNFDTVTNRVNNEFARSSKFSSDP